MEALLGVAGAGAGMLILFLLYSGSAGVALHLIEGLKARKRRTD